MSVEIAWKQNILVTDFQLLKSLLVVLGFGSQAFICGFSRQNICSVLNQSPLSTICNSTIPWWPKIRTIRGPPVLSARFQLENWSAPSRLGSELSQLELAWKNISKINWPLQCGSFFRVFQFLRFAYYRWQWNSGILQEFQSKSRWLHLSGTYEKSGKHNYLLTVCKNRLSHEDLLRIWIICCLLWYRNH